METKLKDTQICYKYLGLPIDAEHNITCYTVLSPSLA